MDNGFRNARNCPSSHIAFWQKGLIIFFLLALLVVPVAAAEGDALSDSDFNTVLYSSSSVQSFYVPVITPDSPFSSKIILSVPGSTFFCSFTGNGYQFIFDEYDENGVLILTHSLQVSLNFSSFTLSDNCAYLVIRRSASLSLSNAKFSFYSTYPSSFSSLRPWYSFLRASGVNEEWASIGTVFVSSLGIYSLMKLLLLVFKR